MVDVGDHMGIDMLLSPRICDSRAVFSKRRCKLNSHA